MLVVVRVGRSSAGTEGEEGPVGLLDGVPSSSSVAMVRMKVRGNCTQKPTAKNIALD